MKKGFQIQIQANLTAEEMAQARKHADEFIKETLDHPAWKYKGQNTKGGYHSFWKRNTFGLRLDWGKSNLVFRRISKNRRVFGVVRDTELQFLDGRASQGCWCPTCSGIAYVKWKNERPKMITYYTIGEIKG